ncbi:MAG: hypothetical protein ACOC2C_07735 [Cyclonatronaceae bacterium]
MQDPEKRIPNTSSKHLNRSNICTETHQSYHNSTSGSQYKVDMCRVKNLHELSCDMLSLSFLEKEEEIYTLNDLREMY